MRGGAEARIADIGPFQLYARVSGQWQWRETYESRPRPSASEVAAIFGPGVYRLLDKAGVELVFTVGSEAMAQAPRRESRVEAELSPVTGELSPMTGADAIERAVGRALQPLIGRMEQVLQASQPVESHSLLDGLHEQLEAIEAKAGATDVAAEVRALRELIVAREDNPTSAESEVAALRERVEALERTSERSEQAEAKVLGLAKELGRHMEKLARQVQDLEAKLTAARAEIERLRRAKDTEHTVIVNKLQALERAQRKDAADYLMPGLVGLAGGLLGQWLARNSDDLVGPLQIFQKALRSPSESTTEGAQTPAAPAAPWASLLPQAEGMADSTALQIIDQHAAARGVTRDQLIEWAQTQFGGSLTLQQLAFSLSWLESEPK